MNIYSYKKNAALAATLLGFASTGCISDPKYVEEDFGLSVKQMVSAQIYDPVAASKPAELGPLLLDGEVAATSVDTYRESAKKPEKNQSIIFSVN